MWRSLSGIMKWGWVNQKAKNSKVKIQNGEVLLNFDFLLFNFLKSVVSVTVTSFKYEFNWCFQLADWISGFTQDVGGSWFVGGDWRLNAWKLEAFYSEIGGFLDWT